jgi:hypothetical protein
LSAAGRKGWVYVLTNPAFPGLVKIGCTSRTPEERARELSSATGVPARYVVAWACPVSDWQAVEARTHGKLHACRPNGHREFFRCSVEEARREVERAARAYMRPAWLRLVVGPPLTRTPTRPVWARSGRGGGDPLGARLLALVLILGVVLAVLRPTPPSWAPVGLVRSVMWIELHAPRRL